MAAKMGDSPGPTPGLLPDPDVMAEHAETAAAVLRALGNRNRLMILCVLVNGEISVGEINRTVPLSQSALSQHLARLRQEGLVATRREAQTIYYRIQDPAIMELMATLYGLYCKPES